MDLSSLPIQQYCRAHNAGLLILWSPAAELANARLEEFQQAANAIREDCSRLDVAVQIEAAQQLVQSRHAAASFGLILAGITPASLSVPLEEVVLVEAARLLRPSGVLKLHQVAADAAVVRRALLLAGFVNADVGVAETPGYVSATANVPDYQPGSSMALRTAVPAPAVWQLDALADDDLIDTDALLTSADVARPAPVAACGVSLSSEGMGRKKACKNCSCGLAEVQASGASVNDGAGVDSGAGAAVKSSCGSCYLGDAFRCASCPYIGMPPFKPGEKIQLSDRLLQADQ